MTKQKLNENWTVFDSTVSPMMARLRGNDGSIKKVNLPYDAMIHEKRREDVPGGAQSGFYPGGYYYFIKNLFVPEDWKCRKAVLEFEGVYRNAKVYINGEYAGGYPNGYSNFYIKLDDFLRYGVDNEIKVCVENSSQPSSRWYTGSGIYRNVNLILGNLLHIGTNGVKIRTPEADSKSAVVLTDVTLVNEELHLKKVLVHTSVTDKNGTEAACDKTEVTVYGNSEITIRQRMHIEAPFLWSCDTPDLYTCLVRVEDAAAGQETDTEAVDFGIRTLQLDAVNGLRINGSETKLRGSCIHHDNGVLGAATLEDAEERRCRQLKEAGFNCIRSAHHPMSKAMLDACDRVGMLVMDELSDMWNLPKNTCDYSGQFADYWERDIEYLVDKDFNHPSVILYSLGNEIPEAGTARGAHLNRRISGKLKTLDDTRYTTNAINGLLAAAPRIGEIMADLTGMSPEEMMSKMMAGKKENTDADGKESGEGGSNGLNNALSLMSGPLGDAFAAHPVMTELIEEFASGTDVAGYNYMTGRHVLEHTLHPNRIVLGAETYPADIVRLWDIVRKNPHVIGDMTWTGYDYLGEAGCGIFYYDGAMNFTSHWPDSIAYIGDIDITGYRRPISYLREIVFGLRKAPYIAVERINRHGQKHSQTPWMLKDNIASWTWPGYEGKPALIDVYSDAEEVELLLNGQSLGRKGAGEMNGYTAAFETDYIPGELKAVCYRAGERAEEMLLETADSKVTLQVKAEDKEWKADGSSLAYIEIALVDGEGRSNLHEQREVSVRIEGPAVIQGFGSADPQTDNSYDNTVWKTYDGRLLAVLRAGAESGAVTVSISTEGEEQSILLHTVS